MGNGLHLDQRIRDRMWTEGDGMDVQAIVNEVKEKHFPEPGASVTEIVDFEHRVGFQLPNDMREFYRHVNGAKLFDPVFPPYRFLPIAQIELVAALIFGRDSAIDSPQSWYAICDVGDGNYVAADLSSTMGEKFSMIDCFHEAFPDPEYCKPITHSFSQFLLNALRSNGRLFWL